MSKKVLVSILKQHKITRDCSVFIVNDVKYGYYDAGNMIFYDENTQACYESIGAVARKGIDNSFAFGNLVSGNELLQLMNNDYSNMESVLRKYRDQTGNSFFIVHVDGKNKEKISIIRLKTEDIKNISHTFATEKIESGELRLDSSKNLTASQVLRMIENAVLAGSCSTDDLKKIKDEILAVRDTADLLLQTVNDENVSSPKVKVSDSSKISALQIFNIIRKTVVHQDEALYRLAVEITRNLLTDDKDGILITGSTGVGKTLTINVLAKILNRPVLIIDSTQLTIPGYAGKNIEEYLYDLYLESGCDVSKAESAIVYFDEIDKKGSEKKSDVSGQGVLNVLLKFLDGTSYDATTSLKSSSDSHVKISTKNMLVLAGGSFTDVYKNKPNRQIGFSDEKEKDYVPTVDDFVSKGMMTKDFMGRFPIVIHYDDLDKEGLKDIIINSALSPLQREINIFDKIGVKLSVTPEYIDAVAEAAFSGTVTGARGLKGVIKNTTWRCFAEVDNGDSLYKEAILDERAVSDNKVYKLIKRED